MKRYWPAVIGVVLVGLLAGCVTYVPVAETGKPVANGSVVVTGKISFDPNIVQKWGALDFAVKASYEKKAFVLLSSKPVTSITSIQKADRVMSVDWDHYFHVTMPKDQSYYWVTVYVILSEVGTTTDALYLSSPFKISFQPGDRFVYLGDFVYQLNATNQLGGKEVHLHIEDHFAQAQQKFGGSFVGANGEPLQLVKEIPAHVPKLNAKVIETTVQTYYY